MSQQKRSRFGFLDALLSWMMLVISVQGLSSGNTCYYPHSRSSSSSLSSIGSGYEMEEDFSAKVNSAVDNPTETMPSFMTTPPANPKPKIVVLGATGRIGRRIVKQLMDVDIDMEVVAFVRDYNKACEVLYDDGILVQREGDGKGPRLQLVVGNLVTRQEVYGYKDEDEEEDDDDDDDDDINYAPAISASRFYGNDISEYILPKDKQAEMLLNDPNSALKDAISDATVIISAVGTVRPTNLWTDFIIAPWRIFSSPANWCTDRTHPYYVNNYAQTKLIAYAEKEQLKRQLAWDTFHQDQLDMQKEANARGYYYETHMEKENKQSNSSIPRIRFIRISDLCITQPTFGIVTVLTNIARSLVFREQYRGEKCILQQAKNIDTIILRPGDLTDEERNVNTTSLQVSCDGVLPQPALVGRDDVAALAVAAAVTKLDFETARDTRKNPSYYNDRHPIRKNQNSKKPNNENKLKQESKHFTIAVRWATDHLMQGTKKDGRPNAQSCMNYIVKEEARRMKHLRLMTAVRNSSPSSRVLSPYITMISKKIMQFRPYSFFVALPLYTMLTSLCFSTWKVVPGRKAIVALLTPYIKQISMILFKFMNLLLSSLQRGGVKFQKLLAL